jgi:hypothetical protein
MAESLRYRVEEHLTCSVCLKPFKDPKVLPCLHSYCHVCIVNLAKNANSNTINCPECRLTVEVRKMYTNVHLCSLLYYFTLSNTRWFNSITRRALALNGLMKLSAHVPTVVRQTFQLSRGECAHRVTPPTSYSPVYITPTHTKSIILEYIDTRRN